MNVSEYKEHLESKGLKVLKPLYKKVFGQKPASKLTKSQIIDTLVKKYEETRRNLNGDDYVEAEAREAAAEAKAEAAPEVEKKTAKRGSRAGSRRGTICEEVQFGIWDSGTLAEALQIVNPTWPVAKNKSAISGTLADMRKNKGWKINYSDDAANKGRICVKV